MAHIFIKYQPLTKQFDLPQLIQLQLTRPMKEKKIQPRLNELKLNQTGLNLQNLDSDGA